MCVLMQLQSVLQLYSNFYNIIFKTKHYIYNFKVSPLPTPTLHPLAAIKTLSEHLVNS